jgi:nitrogen fixation protein FixH
MTEDSDYRPGGRPLTGRKVLGLLAGFFGVMLLANFIMAREAVKTFSGLDTDNPYDSGLAYNQDIAASKAQAALGWIVELTRTPDGQATQLTATIKDKTGQPVTGLDVSMHFLHPATRKFDHELMAAAIADGVYAGAADLAPGRWEVEIDLKRNGERQFRSRNQLTIE